MKKVNPLKRLVDLVLMDKHEVVSIYFYAILSGFVQLSVPLGVQAIISFVLGASMVTSIYVLIFIIVLGVVLSGVLQINQMKLIEKIQQKIFTRYAFQFADTIPQIDLLKANKYYLPEKVSRFFDTISIQKGISKILLDIPLASIQIILGLVLLVFYHPVFIVFGILLLVTLYVIIKLTEKKGYTTSMQESQSKYEVVAWYGEMGRILKSFKLRHGTNFNMKRTDDNVLGYLSARTEHFKVLLFQYRALVVLKVMITTTMLIVGTYLLIIQVLNIGEFIAAEIVILMIIGAVEKLISNIDSIYDVIVGLEKLASVGELSKENNGKIKYASTGNGISIEMVDFEFGYTSEASFFENIDLIIPSNSNVCIVGEEGVGKTTLLNILASNYSGNTKGLMFNNILRDNYELESLRKKTGLYLNNSELFQGTLIDNITLGREDVMPSLIIDLAKEIGFQNFLRTFSSGFETMIDPEGKKLSRTVVQKILLLRSLINQSDLILLDDPFLGFSEQLQKKILSYIVNNLSKSTVVLVSDNVEIQNVCDYVLKIENGDFKMIKNS